MSASAFLREFIRNWKTVGAVAPSSRELANLMMEAAGVAGAQRILELGPGTGAFTQAIADVMKPGASYLGLEVNESFVKQLRPRFPQMRFEVTCAQEFDLTTPEFADGFDVIISGLPWTAFPESLQRAILSNVLPHLVPHGCFATFAYFGFHHLPGGRRFRALVESLMPCVTTTRVVWPNLPPAFVYLARHH